MKEKYRVTGMTCSACSSHVEKAVRKLDGIEKVAVNLLTGTMEVHYDEKVLGGKEITEAVEMAGYGASPMEKTGEDNAGKASDTVGMERNILKEQAKQEEKAMRQRLWVSLGFLVPLMYVAMFHMLQEWFGLPVPDWIMKVFHGSENAINFGLTQFLLVLPILYMNRQFFIKGFRTLAYRNPNMDSLIALGASAAVGYGIFALYRIGYGLGHGEMALAEQYAQDLYFESAGTILTLITVGKYLETRSKGKTSEAINKLLDLAPKTAIRLTESGTEEEVPTELLQKGDIFLVKPGSTVPVDGIVLEGNSSVDESAITGESVPAEKQTGDKVVSATMNKAGFLKCRAEKVGEDTTIAQIIRLVEEASASKAPIAQLADKIAGVFVPVVIVVALVTLAVWLFAGAGAEFAISSAIAVLVISCPCALGLATPVAIMVGTGVGARHGILIKSGEALQRVKTIDTVVLDKTGTITEGKLRVMQVVSFVDRYTEEGILKIASALESRSEHPLAEAVVEACGTGLKDLKIHDFQAVFGRGIRGILEAEQLEKGSYYVGNEAFMKEQGITPRAEVLQTVNTMADDGQTPLLVADEKMLLGVIGVADTIRESSCVAIETWREMGIDVIMLTGDNRRTAEAVKRKISLTEVIAEVLPQEKERKISALKEQGHKVAMIGDGINDAPALAAADVGMAIGAGTDVAMESADIVLMKSDLRDAVTAMRLSRRVIRNIKENLFWAFFYNCIGIPLAAGLWYPLFEIRLNPMFGAAAMSLSSIFVVCNALRLRGFRSEFPGNKGLPEREINEAEEIREKENKETENKDAENKETANKETENKEKGNKEKIINENKEKGKVNNMKKVMKIEGMMCGHCTGRVQKVLENVGGVAEVVMSLEEKTATVTLTKEVADDVLVAVVTDAGYEVVGVE